MTSRFKVAAKPGELFQMILSLKGEAAKGEAAKGAAAKAQGTR